MKSSDKKESSQKERSERELLVKKIVMLVILFIIFILLLISCTSGLWGKIGDIFQGSSDYTIDDDNNEFKKIYNQELKFIIPSGEVELGNTYKVEFTTTAIHPNNYTCITDKAEIATCTVNGNFVEVYTKKTGKVTVSVIANTNGYEYIGTHTLTVISSEEKGITLDNYSETLYLESSNTLRFAYYLNNINGKVTVTSSDPSIATAEIKNNVVIVTAKKTGNVKITLSVTDDKEYTTTMNLTIKDKVETNKKSSENRLSSLKISSGSLSPKFNSDTINYKVSVNSNTSTITINESKKDDKATVYYYVNGSRKKTLKNISLDYGNNEIVIVVEAENGSTKKYTVVVNRKKNDTTDPTVSPTPTPTPTPTDTPADDKSDINTLDQITLSNNLNLNFNKNKLSYTITVPNSINKVSVTAKKTDPKSTVKYYVDGVEVSNLSNISIADDKTTVAEIKVTSESGKEKIYKVRLTHSESDINTLDNLVIDGYTINFNPTTNNYEIKVNYNTESIKLTATKTDDNSTIEYKIGNTIVTDPSQIKLSEGKNIISVIVTSASGIDNTYQVVVVKPIRKVVIRNSSTNINIENSPINFIYNVYEDKNADGNFVLTDDYNLSDISYSISNFKGTKTISKGIVTIEPSIQDIDKTYTLTVKYLDKSDSLTFKVVMKDYYLNALKDIYNFNLTDDNKESAIILNTNIFNNQINSRDITDGIELSNDYASVTITSSNPNVLKVKYNSDDNQNVSTSIAFRNELIKNGTVKLTIKAKAYGKELPTKVITVNVIKKYVVTLDALDGFYDSFTSKYVYEVNHGEKVKLSDYFAYKVDTTGNCLYFSIESYNTKKDGTGTKYSLDKVITITKDTTLYAIYSSVSKFEDIKDESIMYLTEVDLFHNEEYYKKYNVDKVIYPNANGSHVMNIQNNTASTIEITNINLTEDTTCIGNLGCINMAYIIKHTKPNENNWKYFYGGENTYQILNKDPNVIKNNTNGYQNSITVPNSLSSSSDSIILEPGEGVTISLLWKWLGIDNNLDTKIGNITEDQDYSIKVSIEYQKTSKYCNLNNN